MQRLSRFIEERSVWILAALFAFSLLAVAYYAVRQQRLTVQTSALDAAKIYGEALTEFRSVYTSEVIGQLRNTRVKVVHDYQNKQGSIPLPTTLTIVLGERIGDRYQKASVKLYSPYPFPWRKKLGGLQDEFARQAWTSLNEDPEKPYYRFETVGEKPYLRYATADRIRQTCISCHNNHPATPRKGWKLDDVRGVLEIRYPINQSITPEQASSHNGLLLVVLVFSLGYVGVATVLYNGRRAKDVINRELAMSDDRIRGVVASILEAVIVIDVHGSVQSLNPPGEKMFGYTEREIIGENVSMLMPSPYREEHDQYLINYLTTGIPRIIGVRSRRVSGRHKDGTVFDIELAVNETGFGDERAFTGIVRDISLQLAHERKLEELSTLDSLTGIANRRFFEESLEKEWRRCVRERSSLAIIFFDIDHFKQHNDHYGHLAGDECLKAVANTIASAGERPGDVTARYGGEEFVLILPATDSTGAKAVAEHIRQNVLALGIEHEHQAASRYLTISAGVASVVPTRSMEPAELLDRADKALYRAKVAGRNQVVADA